MLSDNTLVRLGDSRGDLISIAGSLEELGIARENLEEEKFENLIHAIKVRTEKNKHSDFYTILEKVNQRILMYKSLFLEKRPKYMKD
jgi:hypothetical protein